jgi:GT2 family glycosyltransferase
MRISASSDRPIVTIGILCHDAARYIGRTIPAILSWLRPSYEVVVLDNGSSDATADRLKQFHQIRVVCNTENVGYGRGKNMLVELARGQFVLLLDDDVLVSSEDVLIECLAFCHSRPDAAFVSVPLMEDGRARTPHYGLFFGRRKVDRTLEDLHAHGSFEVGGFVGGLTFVRKSVFEHLGGYETIYPCQDYDLCARAHLQGWRIFTVTSAHAVHLGTDRRNIDRWAYWYEYHLCGVLRTILKNYTLGAAMLWAPLATLWIFWKTLRKYGQTRDARVLYTYAKSIGYFFRDLPDTLRERARIQGSRVVTRDAFLWIDIPAERRGCRKREPRRAGVRASS